MEILLSICARGGSKGIPHKNIKLLNNKPLIAYTYETALKFQKAFKGNVTIELSTDCSTIKDVAESLGLKTNYVRPASLADDKAGKLDVFIDLLNYSEKAHAKHFDYFLDLDVSSPLRSLDDLLEAFDIIEKDDQALDLFSVNKANKNPYFNMVEKNSNGFYELSKKLDSNVLSRQTAPSVYELNASFYFFKRSFFNQNYKSVITDRSLIYEMNHICFDIDHKIDFEFMEFLILNDKLDFTL